MFFQLSRSWWWLALRGIGVILFGIIALVWPGATLHSIMLLFGGVALVDGLLCIRAALTHAVGTSRRWVLFHGLISVAIAVCVFIWREAAASILLYLMAAWALVTGGLELVGARRLDWDVSNERLLRWSGFASILFAVLVLCLPIMNGLSMVRLIPAFAIAFGLLILVFSLNFRSIGKYAYSLRQQ